TAFVRPTVNGQPRTVCPRARDSNTMPPLSGGGMRKKRIGLLFGMEDTFPWALISAINARGGDRVLAMPVEISYIKDDGVFDYDQTRDLVMMAQEAIEFDSYFRCYVLGRKRVHIMQYDPKQPHHLRYVQNPEPLSEQFDARLRRNAIALCEALGYDMNTVELAVRDGIPYAIDFMNCAPD